MIQFKTHSTRLFVIAVVLTGLLLSAGCTGPGPIGPPYTGLAEQLSASTQSGIWVSGEGEVAVVPDIVQLSLGVSAQSNTVAEAQRQAREAMEKVKAVLRSQGIAEKDIQTQSFRIDPVTKYDQKTSTSQIVGYRVDNIVSIKIRKVADAGKVIDAVAEAGGDLTRIQSIRFTVDDPKPYYVQAREIAVKDARDKAVQLANHAGVNLGKLTYVSETGVSLPQPRVFADGLAASEAKVAATEISPGELKIRLSLQVRFSIE